MPKKIALLIGVSEYGEGIPSLSAPPNDVAAMQRVLQDPQMGNFAQIETLINPEFTPMQKAIRKLFSDCEREDLALLYFSGHGISGDDNRLYLATRDTTKDDFEATAVPASFIQHQSGSFYVKRQVIILDCCYSGAFAVGWQPKSIDSNFIKQALGEQGRVVLTSSTSTQRSFQEEDTKLGLSLYTQYLVEGIETGAADKDGDGKILVKELHDYAKAKVREVKPRMQPDIIIRDGEAYEILLSQAPVNAPELKFRRLAEQDASQGEISEYRREFLKAKQQEFGVSDEKAAEIIDSVLEPGRKRLANLARYREAYQQEVKRRYPLNERKISDLKDWQQTVLGLRDKDVAPIQEQIVCQRMRQIPGERHPISSPNSRSHAQRAGHPEPSEHRPNGTRELLLLSALIVGGWFGALVFFNLMEAKSNSPFVESLASSIGGFLNGVAIWSSQNSNSHDSQGLLKILLFGLSGAIVGILMWQLIPNERDNSLLQVGFSSAIGILGLFLYRTFWNRGRF